MRRLLALSVLLTVHCGPNADPPVVTSADAGRACPREPLKPGSPGMVIVPAGEFVMGCDYNVDPRCDFDELPVRHVTLSAYEIDRTEVTERDWAACVAADVCRSLKTSEPPGTLPILGVNFQDADDYCRFVSKRLPTEAEWEKAARGATGCRFPWGDQEPDCSRANYVECGSRPRTVGAEASASPYGVLDLAGNACEWVADWYEGGYTRPLQVSDPRGATSGTYRVVRGGAFFSPASALRVTERDFADPKLGQSYLGFRCVRSL